MRTVTLQRLTLLNFKNIRNAELTFNHTATTISGANGTGKTTIFDAFTWVLFGKDSKGRTKFNLKTIDNATGETIDRLPHEVTAVLNVDGQTIELTRRLEEKWVKAKGATTEEFKGHDEKRLYNGVEQSVKDWQAKIDAICPEQVFRYLTDPTAFTAQKADAQREMLFDLAGRVSDEEVAGDNADFVALLAGLSGKSIEERRKEISAKRKRLNAEAVS